MKLVPPSQITYGSDFPYFPLDHDGGPLALVVVLVRWPNWCK
jgi:hypothetical protein